MASILIAGCGMTGAEVARSLVDSGHHVYGLKRHPPTDERDINYIKADLTSSADLEAIHVKIDLVVYILSPDDRSEQSYRDVFERGVHNVLQVFTQQSAATRFIFISSTSVYGQMNGEWVDENSITEPKSVTAKIILNAERAFLANSRRNCVIRFSGIYGRGKSYLLDAVANSREVQYEPPCYTNRIHWQDCVRVILFIAGKMIDHENLESVYLASDNDPAPKWEVFNYLANRLDLEPPQKAVLPQDTAQNKRCSNRRLKQLGFRFKYSSYRDGYRHIGPADAGG
ncbi:MAG: SDR family oxidoreductase [Gammaproteobacteria bacterium]